MTIPITLPFGRRRLIFSMRLFVVRPPLTTSKAAVGSEVASQFPGALDATDIELAKLNGRAAAEAERQRWQVQAICYGVRN